MTPEQLSEKGLLLMPVQSSVEMARRLRVEPARRCRERILSLKMVVLDCSSKFKFVSDSLVFWNFWNSLFRLV